MKFISTKGMTNETAPEGKVLVQYLEPCFGLWYVEYAIGYYDNPNYYDDPKEGDGWKHWQTENKINVLAYCLLPEAPRAEIARMSQKDFIAKYGHHPNLGCVGE
jgi:hypothetical protein